jgi:signal transduction histidine kinase/PAS domain-containing protein
MDILEDPGGELTIDGVASPEYASRFTSSQEDVPIYSWTDSAFWLRLRLRNDTRLTIQWMLEVNFPNLNYVDLYLPLEGGGYSVKQSGALRPFDSRDIPYYHVVFQVPLEREDAQTFYIRVKSGSSMTLAFTLWSPKAFALSKINNMLIVGLFYGALLIMLGYQLLLFYSLKEAIYFYFVIFLAGSILFFATYEGVADQYLWPSLSQYKLPFLVVTQVLFFMASLKFSDVFLELKIRAPRLHQLFYLIIGIWGSMIVIMILTSYLVMSRLTAPLIFFTPAFAALAGIYLWRTGYKPARFYLASWLGFILGIMTAELVRGGVLPSTPLTERSYQIGLIWLVALWALALADRINLLKEETEEANTRLRSSESRLTQFLEAMPVGVMVYDAKEKPHFFNERARTLLSEPGQGIQLENPLAFTLKDLTSSFKLYRPGAEEPYSFENRPLIRAIHGENAEDLDVEVAVGNRRIPVEAWARPILDEQNRVQYALLAFQDITRRKLAEAELEEYRHQLEQLVEKRTTELSAANKQLQAENAERKRLEEMLRLRLEWLVVINQVSQAVTKPADLPAAYRQITDIIKKLYGASDVFLVELDEKNDELTVISHSCQDGANVDLAGSTIPIPNSVLSNQPLERGTPVNISRDQLNRLEGPLGDHFRGGESQSFAIVPLMIGKNTVGLLGLEFTEKERYFSAEEITRLERICLDILQLREKPRIFEQTQSMIMADERNRLARDLHDSVTQVLFSASLVAEVLPQIWRRDPAMALASLEELRRLNHGALAEMRTMLLELRPSAVIRTPLSELLAQLTEAITSRTGLPFQLFIETTPPLPEDVHEGFYRIAQESLNNVVKHARASHVSVSLSAASQGINSNGAWKGDIKLIVRDDGRGFTVQEEGSQHLGLGIMRERAEAIGAELSLESQPGVGTTVTLSWEC